MTFLFGLRSLLPGAHRARFASSNSSAANDNDWPITVIEPRPERPNGHRTGGRELVAIGEAMQRAATRQRHVLAILVLKLSDLREVRVLCGREAAEDVAKAVLAKLSELATDRGGAAMRTAEDAFAVLVRGATGAELHSALQDRLGEACTVEFEMDGEEIPLVPDVLARTINHSESVREAYHALCRDIDSERQLEESRCDYLRREREAHTIPGELVSSAPRARSA